MIVTRKVILLSCTCREGYVTVVDVFMKLGYLHPIDYESWRMKRIPYLERVITVILSQISFIMKALRRICCEAELKPSWTGYNSWGRAKRLESVFQRPEMRTLSGHTQRISFQRKGNEIQKASFPNESTKNPRQKGTGTGDQLLSIAFIPAIFSIRLRIVPNGSTGTKILL